MSTTSYPKILHIGDKPIADLYEGDVEITEKIDGSQFGFGLVDGELVCRSKGKEQELDNPDELFAEGVAYVKSIQDRLPPDIFFYGEYLSKPRHSTLAYDRIPQNHIALFGALKSDKTLYDFDSLKSFASAFDVDTVPLIYSGKSDAEHTLSLLETVSYLGGQKIEGVVVKRYEDWLFLGRILCPVKAGKYVSEQFKEVHQKDWAKLNTAKGGLEDLKASYRTEARWNKAIQHLRDDGDFEGTVRDIGKLIAEVSKDVTEEEKENIKEKLWQIYGKDILRHATGGMVEWYKEKIAKGEFQDI
jgi:hypothetical protein